MNAEYRQPGNNLDYYNDTDAVIYFGTVIPLESSIGVAGTNIDPGDTGALLITGVFKMPKDNSNIKFGDAVYYDADADVITTTVESNVRAGIAATTAGATAGTVDVKINA